MDSLANYPLVKQIDPYYLEESILDLLDGTWVGLRGSINRCFFCASQPIYFISMIKSGNKFYEFFCEKHDCDRT